MTSTKSTTDRTAIARFCGFRPVAASRRRGAAMLEGAIVMTVFLTLIFGMLDLSLAVARYNMLSQAARQVTREAIVRGSLAPPTRTAWGPGTFTGTAASQHEIAGIVRNSLPGINPDDLTIRATWPDGGNSEMMRVRVELVLNHRLLMTWIFTDQRIQLTANSTMLIVY
jgi:hypothetical protein